MKNKITVVALIAVVAGVFAYTRPNNAIPSDLRDAPSDTMGQLNRTALQAAGETGSAVVPEASVADVSDSKTVAAGLP